MSSEENSARRVAVIIVNYGTAELTIAAVESVLAAPNRGLSVSVHVIDNASPSDDGAFLSERADGADWGAVTVYRHPENVGFGRGNNAVFQRLETAGPLPDALFLLNPDAILDNDAIAVLAQKMFADDEMAVAGARIEKPGVGPVTSAFRFPSVLGGFEGALQLEVVSRLLARSILPLSPHLTTQPVNWVAGAGVLIRSQAFAEVDGFDPDYFLYYEEVDLMWRLVRAGWRTYFVAEALILHEKGAATNVTGRPAIRRANPAYWYESRRLYHAKTGGRGRALAAGTARLTGSLLNRVHTELRGRPWGAPLGFLSDFWAHALRPLLKRKIGGRHG